MRKHYILNGHYINIQYIYHYVYSFIFQPTYKEFTPKTKEDLSKENMENYKSTLIGIKNEYKISKEKSNLNNKSSNIEFVIKELLNIREQEKLNIKQEFLF